MSEERKTGRSEEEHFKHGQAAERADEGAKPSDIGALDGAAAAGSAINAGTDSEDEGAVPESPPDPTTGPD